MDPKGKSAYLAGAGGGHAIGFALAQAGVARLTIANRTTAKAEDLKARILSLLPDARIDIGTADPSGHDLVVNGTSLGMRDTDPLPLDAGRLTPDQLVRGHHAAARHGAAASGGGARLPHPPWRAHAGLPDRADGRDDGRAGLSR